MREKKRKNTILSENGDLRERKVDERRAKIASAVFLLTILCSISGGISARAAEMGAGRDLILSNSAASRGGISMDGDENVQTGEITVRLREGSGETVKKEIQIFCTKVADIKNGEYILTERYQGAGVDLNEIVSSEDLQTATEKLSGYTDRLDETETQYQMTDQNGEAKFTSLSSGVYMIRGADDPSWDLIVPALTAIPSFDGETGEMNYFVEVEPKHIARAEKEKNTAPQTGLEDETFEYFAGGVLCLTGAVLLILSGVWKKRYER